MPGIPARHPFGAALTRVQNRNTHGRAGAALTRVQNRNTHGRAGAAKRRDARERPPGDFVELEFSSDPAGTPSKKKPRFAGLFHGWRAWRDSNSRPLGS